METDFTATETNQAQAFLDMAEEIKKHHVPTELVILTGKNYLLHVSKLMFSNAMGVDGASESVVLIVCNDEPVEGKQDLYGPLAMGLVDHEPALASRLAVAVRQMPNKRRMPDISDILATGVAAQMLKETLDEILEEQGMPERFKSLRDLYPNRQDRMRHFVDDLGEHCFDCQLAEVCPLLN